MMKQSIVRFLLLVVTVVLMSSCLSEELHIPGDKVTKGTECWLADPNVNCHYSQCLVNYDLYPGQWTTIYVVVSGKAVGKTVTCSFNGRKPDTLFVSDLDNRMFSYHLEHFSGKQTFDVQIPGYKDSHMYVNVNYHP